MTIRRFTQQIGGETKHGLLVDTEAELEAYLAGGRLASPTEAPLGPSDTSGHLFAPERKIA